MDHPAAPAALPLKGLPLQPGRAGSAASAWMARTPLLVAALLCAIGLAAWPWMAGQFVLHLAILACINIVIVNGLLERGAPELGARGGDGGKQKIYFILIDPG